MDSRSDFGQHGKGQRSLLLRDFSAVHFSFVLSWHPLFSVLGLAHWANCDADMYMWNNFLSLWCQSFRLFIGREVLEQRWGRGPGAMLILLVEGGLPLSISSSSSVESCAHALLSFQIPPRVVEVEHVEWSHVFYVVCPPPSSSGLK